MTIMNPEKITKNLALNIQEHSDGVCKIVGHHLGINKTAIPLFNSKVSAGFPSPADDYLEDTVDLNKFLINHPAATFIVRAGGESMMTYIHPNDLLIVDRSITPVLGHIVIAVVDGQLTVKYLRNATNGWLLMPMNPKFKSIPIHENADVCIWGVVIHIIRTVERIL
jgi:DNA polymerase V